MEDLRNVMLKIKVECCNIYGIFLKKVVIINVKRWFLIFGEIWLCVFLEKNIEYFSRECGLYYSFYVICMRMVVKLFI